MTKANISIAIIAKNAEKTIGACLDSIVPYVEEVVKNASVGFCQCGCGQRTRLAPQSSTAQQWVKGQPVRYVLGHGRRGCKGNGRPISPPEVTFWPYVDIANDGCWQWTGPKHPNGYGQVYGPKTKLAHRFAYELLVGTIPDGLCVCHTCDQKGCVNPEHLFLGSPADNTHDMISKGRHAHGDTHWTHFEPERARAIMLYARQFSPYK